MKTQGVNSEAQENKAAPTVDKIAEAVNAWFNEHVHNSPASRDTETFNHLQKSKDSLIQKVKEAAGNGTV